MSPKRDDYAFSNNIEQNAKKTKLIFFDNKK